MNNGVTTVYNNIFFAIKLNLTMHTVRKLWLLNKYQFLEVSCLVIVYAVFIYDTGWLVWIHNDCQGRSQYKY